MKNLKTRLKEFNKGYLADKVQLKYAFMRENAFRFFRGTCHLFYEDMARAKALPKSPLVWMSGDLHVENFGSYKGENRLVYFDLNDFDEAVLGHAVWEVARMVTSIFVAFKTLKIEEARATKMAQLFLKIYAETLAKGKAVYIEPQTAKGIVCTFLTAVSKRKKRTLLKNKTISKKNNKLVLHIDNEHHIELDPALKQELIDYITRWITNDDNSPYNFEVVDAAFRIAGTGSVGVRRYVFLLRSTRDDSEYFMLDMKQATPSSLLPYIKVKQPRWQSEAHRMLTIQNRMQNITPALLSTNEYEGESYVLQELQPTKDKINFKLISDQYRDIYQVINDMAVLTASAQLRSSGHQGAAVADELITFGQNADWQPKVIQYAVLYVKQVNKDYREYVKAYREGYFKPAVAQK
jgi:uncharacterized protein (DUF2252 family)